MYQTNRYFTSIILSTFICIYLASSSILAGFSVNLKDRIIDLKKGSQSTSLQLSNNGENPIAIDVRIMRATFDSYGKESQDEIGEDLFLVYPNQLILMPGETEFTKISWLGPSDLESEVMFRVVSSETPLNLQPNTPTEDNPDGRTGRVSVLLRYVNSLFIKPDNALANLELLPFELKTNDVGDTVLRFTLLNKGNSHISPKSLEFFVTDTATKEEKVFQYEDYVLLLPNSKRYCDFVLKDNGKSLSKNAKFTYKTLDDL
tara:strand:+ start:35593 stop:36372 length:780 start_codon:yes stop_codon:yes gene_type:complete